MVPRPVGRTDVNRSAILAHLGAHGPASRADVARALEVSPALITQLTKDLLSEGLIEERDEQRSGGGRPARLLGLVVSAGRAIGVKLAPDHLSFVEVGLDGRILRSGSEPFDAMQTTVLANLVDALKRIIAAGDGSPLLGLGIGVPGSVDQQDQGVVDSVPLQWQSVPMGQTLTRELGLPVIVENNVNALAAAELLYGLGRGHSDFVIVTIGTGVGSAIVEDGIVVRGSNGGAGELGHVPAVLLTEGERPQVGALEALIAEDALLARAKERGIVSEHAGFSGLVAAATAGDEAASRIFTEAGHLLGQTLAGVVHLLDPELIILSGEGTADWPLWETGFETGFRSALLPLRRGIPVYVERWQDEGWARGAAALVLATPYDVAGHSGKLGERVRARLQRSTSPA